MGPAKTGYRPDHDFGLPGTLNGAAHEYVGREWVSPGENVYALLWLLVPEYQRGRLFEGFKFTVQEGRKVVGTGTVRCVLNPELRMAAPAEVLVPSRLSR
jgi:translation elongation factor EF-Tu-like GTPase